MKYSNIFLNIDVCSYLKTAIIFASFIEGVFSVKRMNFIGISLHSNQKYGQKIHYYSRNLHYIRS